MKRIIFETEDKTYRILEIQDECSTIDDLAGDMFNPETNPNINQKILEIEKKDFINKVNDEGVFGYVLEKWNSNPGQGYEYVDSCFGFVGQYVEGALGYEHYIVNELKSLIKKGVSK